MDPQHSNGDNITISSYYSNYYEGQRTKSRKGYLNQSHTNEFEENKSEEQFLQAKKKECDTQSSFGSQAYRNYQAQQDNQNENDYDPNIIPAPRNIHKMQTQFTGSTKVEPEKITNSVFFKSSK